MNARFVDLPAAQYHQIKALSASGISILLDECPEVFYYWQNKNDDTDTYATKFGTATHAYILEPELFDLNYVVRGRFQSGIKGKIEREQVDMSGAKIISPAEFEIIQILGKKFFNNKYIQALLSRTAKNYREITILWEEEIFIEGQEEPIIVPCKARIDLLFIESFLGTLIIDLKTCDSTNPEKLKISVKKYGYYRQAFWYTYALSQVGYTDNYFIFSFLGKAAPNMIAMHTLNNILLEQGERECMLALEIYAQCLQTNIWPDYTGGKITSL